MKPRRPTRHDLLVIIGRLQNLVGHARARNNDRNPERQGDVDSTLDAAFALCVRARSQDPPLNETGPWAGNGHKHKALDR